jgi:hypothetical protein
VAQFPGRQGGGITGGGVFSLAPDKTVQLAAACTDLLSEPPDETTRFVSPSLGRVALASGSVATLASAVQEGIVAIRGRSNSFDPVRRDGSLLLDLYLVNTSPEPVQVAIQPGTMITPAGQAAQSLPEGADRLFALAGERRLAYSNTIQYAVWAARGSTAEEVEQSNMVRLSSEEITRVQGLLDGSGIHRQFDRERGVYAGKFAATLDRLGEDTTDVKGETLLPNGARARLEGVRRADGKGAVILRPDRKGGEFYYSAEFKKRADGRVDVKLFHLATGRALHMGKSSLILYPTAG